MTGPEYKSALATLGLTQKAAGEWLGVSEKTAKRYATTGPSGPAARAIEMLVMARKFNHRQKVPAAYSLTPRAG